MRAWDDDSRTYIEVESIPFTGRGAVLSLTSYSTTGRNALLEAAPGQSDWIPQGSIKGHEGEAWQAQAKRARAGRQA